MTLPNCIIMLFQIYNALLSRLLYIQEMTKKQTISDEDKTCNSLENLKTVYIHVHKTRGKPWNKPNNGIKSLFQFIQHLHLLSMVCWLFVLPNTHTNSLENSKKYIPKILINFTISSFQLVLLWKSSYKFILNKVVVASREKCKMYSSPY